MKKIAQCKIEIQIVCLVIMVFFTVFVTISQIGECIESSFHSALT